MKIKNVLVASLLTAGIAFAASSTPDEIPCAVMVKFGRGTQVIPPQGKIQTRFEKDQPVVCGSMVITHQDAAWIRHSNQTLFKIASNSFFELSKAKADAHRLYRGELLMTAPSSIPTLIVATPNAEIKFKGGVAWTQYVPEQKETSAAAFNKGFEFRNKFNDHAAQTVRSGELSRLMLSQERIVPSQPTVMSPSSVKEALSGFELASDEHDELVMTVERVFASRAKSLISELEDWNEIEKENVDRAIASVPTSEKKVTRSAIDPKELKFSMELLKKHLYGDEEDLRMLEEGEPQRQPASAKKIADPEYDRKQKKKAQETQRLMKEITDLK